MYCPACGTLNDANTHRCIQCGTVQPQPVAQNHLPVAAHAGHLAPVKSKWAAGLLQIFLPFGIGRFYMGDTSTALMQLFTAVFCSFGVLWCIVDGIMIIAGSNARDGQGRALR